MQYLLLFTRCDRLGRPLNVKKVTVSIIAIIPTRAHGTGTGPTGGIAISAAARTSSAKCQNSQIIPVAVVTEL